MYKIPIIICCDAFDCTEKLSTEVEIKTISIMDKPILNSELNFYMFLKENGWTRTEKYWQEDKSEHYCKTHSKKK